MAHPLHAIFVLVYLLALIAVGAIKAGKIRSQEDFSLAGRGLPATVLIGTLLATWIGTGSLVGNAEKTYQIGLSALILPISGSAGIVALYFLAKRIRDFGQFTIQDILEARFGVAARVLATFALLGAYVIIVSYQYRAGAAVLSRILPEVGITEATCLVAAFVILYTALAGMFSVAYTDVANGVMITIGIACAIPLLLSKAGGWDQVMATLQAHGSQDVDPTSLTAYWTPISLLGLLLPPFLLILGDANMYQRFFSAKDSSTARRSAAGMFVGVLVLELAIIVTALLASSLVSQGVMAEPPLHGHIIISAAFDVLPPFLGAMLIATAVAIVVSTADSYLLAPSTSVVRDIYQRFIDPGASGMKVVLMGRIFVVLLGLVALWLSFLSDSFFYVALFAYTIYGCAITPAILAAFLWRRATSAGAVASIVVGGGMALVWEAASYLAPKGHGWAQWMQANLGVGSYEPVLVAFPLSVLALVIVSLATPPSSEAQMSAI